MAVLFANGQTGLVGATPRPVRDGERALTPDAATLLARLPDRHRCASSTPSMAASRGRRHRSTVGRLTVDAPIVVASVCDGPGDLTLHIDDGSGTDFIVRRTPCDGEVHPRGIPVGPAGRRPGRSPS